MPQSLARILIHLIFSAKNRQPLLRDDLRPELHKYIAAILKALDSPPISIASTSDHVHILFSLSKNRPLIAVIEEVKKRSSKWMKTKGPAFSRFAWQSGYGAFSVSPSKLQNVQRYLQSQQEHHRTRTFQEEFRELLKRHKVPYDEQYLYD
jgi:putative transposase